VDPRAGLNAVAKKTKFPSCQKSKPIRPARSLITPLTELLGLHSGLTKYLTNSIRLPSF